MTTEMNVKAADRAPRRAIPRRGHDTGERAAKHKTRTAALTLCLALLPVMAGDLAAAEEPVAEAPAMVYVPATVRAFTAPTALACGSLKQ